jgi:hypothetical protein
MRSGLFLGRIKSHDFARLLVATWMDEAPTTVELKQALLGRP